MCSELEDFLQMALNSYIGVTAYFRLCRVAYRKRNIWELGDIFCGDEPVKMQGISESRASEPRVTSGGRGARGEEVKPGKGRNCGIDLPH